LSAASVGAALALVARLQEMPDARGLISPFTE
jgi:hypothetical protein